VQATRVISSASSLARQDTGAETIVADRTCRSVSRQLWQHLRRLVAPVAADASGSAPVGFGFRIAIAPIAAAPIDQADVLLI
jgi:hypothetical protein